MRWRRCAFFLGSVLVLAALVTVAVAWGFVIGTPQGPPLASISYKTFLPSGSREPWPGPAPPEWPPSCSAIGEQRMLGLTTVKATRADPAFRSPTCLQLSLFAGWPFRALVVTENAGPWDSANIAKNGVAVTGGYTASPSIELPNWLRGDKPTIWALPLTPVWPGFLLDTLIYAAVLVLPVAPSGVVRWIRRRAGRCVRCGYLLHGTSRCPECSAPVGATPSNERCS